MSVFVLLSLILIFVLFQDPTFDNPRLKRSSGIPTSHVVPVSSNVKGAMVDRHGNLVMRSVDQYVRHTCIFIHSFTHPLIYLSIDPFTHPLIHPSIDPLIHSPIH